MSHLFQWKSMYKMASTVPLSIIQFFNLDPEKKLTRHEVTFMFLKYFRDHKDPENDYVIIPDEKLRTLFGLGPTDKIRVLNIQTYLQKLYDKKE